VKPTNNHLNEWRNALILLRLPFSLFLLPVYLFALVFCNTFTNEYTYETSDAVALFFILHFLVYPASNGYNSYYDQDTEPIGGLETPPPPSKKLLYLVNALDVTALVLTSFFSLATMLWTLAYITASRAYSGKLRLKKYPLLSTILVTGFQGAGVYFLTQSGLGIPFSYNLNFIIPAFGSTFFLMGAYPLTQIYQHKPDAERGDLTLSRMLGIMGTFKFSAVAFAIGGLVIHYSLYTQEGLHAIIIFGLATSLPLLYFIGWWVECKKDKNVANFKNAMRMNIFASATLTVAYLLILFLQDFDKSLFEGLRLLD
jgi:1,4-dihydroxy-2-naphthoate octaprenyltransferase